MLAERIEHREHPAHLLHYDCRDKTRVAAQRCDTYSDTRVLPTPQRLLWTVLGFVTLEINAEQPDMAARITDAPLRAGFESLTRHLALGEYDELYAVTVENTIAGVARRAG